MNKVKVLKLVAKEIKAVAAEPSDNYVTEYKKTATIIKSCLDSMENNDMSAYGVGTPFVKKFEENTIEVIFAGVKLTKEASPYFLFDTAYLEVIKKINAEVSRLESKGDAATFGIRPVDNKSVLVGIFIGLY